MKRGPFYSWLFCASMIFLGATSLPDSQSMSGEVATPMEAMRNTVSQAVGVLQDENLKKPERANERVTRLKKIADSRFDYGEMAKRTLGSEWKNLGDQERHGVFLRLSRK